jgi:hypothetical protein
VVEDGYVAREGEVVVAVGRRWRERGRTGSNSWLDARGGHVRRASGTKRDHPLFAGRACPQARWAGRHATTLRFRRGVRPFVRLCSPAPLPVRRTHPRPGTHRLLALTHRLDPLRESWLIKPRGISSLVRSSACNLIAYVKYETTFGRHAL